jgi:AbrB family looped-hinge helix DNA binding protein
LTFYFFVGIIRAEQVKIGVEIMDMAKLSSKGQITIPAGVRKKLDLKEGDKVMFAEIGRNFFISKSDKPRFDDKDFFGYNPEYPDITSIDDVVNLCKEVRSGAASG